MHITFLWRLGSPLQKPNSTCNISTATQLADMLTYPCTICCHANTTLNNSPSKTHNSPSLCYNIEVL